MLDVHPPHSPTHTWKDFFIHIATIVVGLLIAVGLEQTVEAIHHSRQRHELEEALKRDSDENAGYIKNDIAVIQSVMDWSTQEAAAIEKAGPTAPLVLHRQPEGEIFLPNAGVWLAAKANGVASLLPAGEQNWFEELDRFGGETFVSNNSSLHQLNAAYASLDQVVAGHTVDTSSNQLDISSLNPTQRSLVVANLRSIAEHARAVLNGLVGYSEDSEYIFSTPADQLSNPKQLERFFAIDRAIRKTHPALRYNFSPK